MPRTARRAALAALTALAAVAAIIAADLTLPASAQSDDETAGRIVARLLDDGRVEFGWQPTGGERVLPRSRYFPTDATVDRWLRSSPVEVGGTEIGRINARLLEDGRIEFAFTPTDRERITPQARYFPAGARVGRWLRSTEIAIGPARAGYIAVSAGQDHTCAIRASDSAIECWGIDEYAPDGRFTAVSAGVGHTCAIRENDSAIECWGHNEYGSTDAPEGSFTAISAGWSHSCAIRASDGAIECWGLKGVITQSLDGERGVRETGQTDAPDGSYTAVSTSAWHSCAIHAGSGALGCWGGWYYTYYRETATPQEGQGVHTAPQGSHTAVGASRASNCAIHESGELTCWGWDQHGTGKLNPPEGSYTAVAAGHEHFCAIRESDSTIACWGLNESGQSDAPDGSFSAITAGGAHTCAIRANSGAIECWGWNEHGQATPPPN